MSNEQTILEDHDILKRVENKPALYRDLAIGVNLTGLDEENTARVKMLIRLGQMMSDELEDARAMPAFADFYQQISNQINENQKIINESSNKLLEYSQCRVNSLLRK